MSSARIKRLYDAVLAGAGLAVLSPVFFAIGLVIWRKEGLPVFYKQERVGQGGRLFWIWKFRTMRVDADKAGPGVTRGGDARVTGVGRFLRRTKLDELPQLWNVLKGEMSLVGPRPEVPYYVARYTEEQRGILVYKPGITDLATLEFSDEEEFLRSAADLDEFYLSVCVPRKIELNREYARKSGILRDTLLILETLFFWKRGRRGAVDGRLVAGMRGPAG